MCVMMNAVRAQSCGCVQNVHGGRLRAEQHSGDVRQKNIVELEKIADNLLPQLFRLRFDA